jgi:Ca2+-binding EF-hand superfamily protein
MRKYLLAIALAGTAIGGAAIAGQMGGGAMRADTDNDGAISRAEYMAQSDQRFARLDANGDGQLSGDELAGRGGRRMADADTNKDGKISKAEFAAQAADRFAKLDVNKDGKISRDEMKAMMERMREGRGGPGMTPPPPGGGDAMGERGGRGGMMARFDTDHDGRISHAEALAQAEAHFAKLDTNKDGFIDKAEMDAAHDRMKQHMGKMRGHWRHDPGAPGTPPSPPAATTP